MEDSSNSDECWEMNNVDNEAVEEEEVDIVMHDNTNGDFELCEPASGMSFPSEEAVKSFYGQYASILGFGLKLRNSRKGRDGKLHYFVLTCSREGTHVANTLKTLPTIKNSCEARIRVSLKDERWYIGKAILDHSHELSPAKSMMLKVNKASMHVNRTIEISHEAKVVINKTIQSLACDVGGCESFKKRRAIGKEGDGKALMSYFLRMREQNHNCFYDIDLDDFFCVKNVFWADARSRATYGSFGDVDTFDTTFLTKKYDMQFVSFVGVNHHGQYILLGCGLLSSEDSESFVWLFESWLRCMSGNPPKGIVTAMQINTKCNSASLSNNPT